MLGWTLEDLITKTIEAMRVDEVKINAECAAFGA